MNERTFFLTMCVARVLASRESFVCGVRPRAHRSLVSLWSLSLIRVCARSLNAGERTHNTHTYVSQAHACVRDSLVEMEHCRTNVLRS